MDLEDVRYARCQCNKLIKPDCRCTSTTHRKPYFVCLSCEKFHATKEGK